jgi:MCRA family
LTLIDSPVYLVGGGIASMAAAAFMIRDGDVLGHNITIFEELDKIGGSLDGSGCLWDTFADVDGFVDEVLAELAAWAPIAAAGCHPSPSPCRCKAIARGRDGQFIPTGMCWVVERSFVFRDSSDGRPAITRVALHLCLAEPLLAVEHHLRALEGVPHRFRCDRVHLDRLSPPQASRRRRLSARRLQTDRKPPALWSYRPLL